MPPQLRRSPVAGAVLLLIALLIPSAAVGAISITADVRSDISAEVDRYVTGRLSATGVPAAAVAIVRDGETVHLAGYGDSNGAGVTADTPFLIGSVSKPFTGVAVHQLIRDGRLALEEPVSPYLEAATGATVPAFEGVLMEHLVNHTSGLPTGLALPGSVPVRTEPDALQQRVVDIAERHVKAREAGDAYEYANANYILLAWIVEQVARQPFDEYMHTNVYQPVGMTDSFASADHPSAAELIGGHESWFGFWRPSEQPYDPAGVGMGYMGSTARDMASFLEAQLGSPPAALPFTVGDVAEEESRSTGWDVPLEAGIARGWFTDEVAGHRTVSHAGSLGDYAAHLITIPHADGLGIAVLQNASAFIAAGHEGQYDLSLGLMDLLLGREGAATDPSPLMTVVVPLLAWGIGLAVIILAVRHMKGRGAVRAAGTGARMPLASLIVPSLAYGALALLLLVAVPMLAVPWASAQLFYPDMAWGAVVSGNVALAWAVGRVVVGIRDMRALRQPPAAPASLRGGGGPGSHRGPARLGDPRQSG